MKVLAVFILCLTTAAFADDFKLVTGKEYKNVTVSRVEADGIVLKTKSGISKVYFVELPNDVQQRFHYNAAIASAYSAQAQQPVNQARMAAALRGEPIEVISHGAQVDLNQHLALGNVTVVDFYAVVWPVSAALTEARADGEKRCRYRAPQNRHRQLENASRAAIQHSLHSAGERLRSQWRPRRHCRGR